MIGFQLLGMRKFWNIRWRAAMDVWEPKVGEILLHNLEHEMPYDESPFRDPDKPHLIDQFHFEISNSGLGTEGQVEFYGPPLASLLEQGSPPHPIEGSPMLSFFFADGAETAMQSVFHPGFEPNRFIHRAYRNSRDEIVSHFRDDILAFM